MNPGINNVLWTVFLFLSVLLNGFHFSWPPWQQQTLPIETPSTIGGPVHDTLKHPPCHVDDIPHYTAYKVTTPITIDGELTEEVWHDAPRSPHFRDLISGGTTVYATQAAVLWDEEYLYVAYWIEEPNLQASLLNRDDKIYMDNDVELFIAGDHGYYEFEINAYGTIYEVLFIWEESFVNHGFSEMVQLDRDRQGVKEFHGVGYKNHPRGKRIGYWNWDFPGLRSAVFLKGSINNDQDRDEGWTVELALPWSGMNLLTKGSAQKAPPMHEDIWRMDFSRFNQYKEPEPAKDSGGWAWSPHGVWDSHVPECFTFIHFSKNPLPTK